ncbi:MAG: hypothetical protein ACJAZP_002100 [Psychromonas sp.]|jgi:hypothetical protein|uniref:DUF3545 family protein n=1 Tax=Psychromonas sp. TaxID=1884585 RepID=UPI0039E712B2
MQYCKTDTDMPADNTLFFTVKKKLPRVRKWREIEAIKAQQKLSRELREMGLDVDFSLSEWAQLRL